MEIVFSLAIGILTASGLWLLFRPRTFQVILGLSLLALSLGGIAMVWTDRYRELLQVFA